MMKTKIVGKTLKIADELSDDDVLVAEGYLVLWGGRDLEQEFFTPDTKFDSDYTKSDVVFLDWEHGMRPDEKEGVFGRVDWKNRIIDETGLLVRHILDRRDRFVRDVVEPLLRAGKLATSSEAVPEGVKVGKKGRIKAWPIRRQSLTVTPAEPRLLVENRIQIVEENDDKMNETKTKPEEKQNAAKDGQLGFDLNGIQEKIDNILSVLDTLPQKSRAPQDEVAQVENYSFADFLRAVRENNAERLARVYKSHKALHGESGTTGGYLVPEDFQETLLAIGREDSAIMNLVTRVPVGTDAGTIPALDVYTAPTAGSGQVAEAGGVDAEQFGAEDTVPYTEPKFRNLQWLVHNVGGYTSIDNSLLADSPLALPAILQQLFGVAIRAKNERNILRGSGVGEPEGLLNAGAAIGVVPATNNVFAYEDALTMLSRFKNITGRARWIFHSSIWPDIGVFETSGGGATFMANLGDGAPGTLLGIPYIVSDHLPQADNSGCVVLADLGTYLWFERMGLTIDFSEHAGFTTNKTYWRFQQRVDGRVWVREPITAPGPGTAYTTSPVVYLND